MATGRFNFVVVTSIDRAECPLAQDPFDPVSANAVRVPDTSLRCRLGLLGGGVVAGSPGLGFRLPQACFRQTFRRRIEEVGNHSIVDCLNLFCQIGMTRTKKVQVFGMSWTTTVAASGIILVDDQVTGELFDGAEQRITGNVVCQPWP